MSEKGNVEALAQKTSKKRKPEQQKEKDAVETHPLKLELEKIKERVETLEQRAPEVVETPQWLPEVESLSHRVGTLELREAQEEGEAPQLLQEVEKLQEQVEALKKENAELREICDGLTEVMGVLKPLELLAWRDEVVEQIRVLQRAVAGAPPPGRERIRVPEPQPYTGVRDAKELENFLFDMEQYLESVGIVDENVKVNTATMYLAGDAKLWWRSQHAEIKANRVQIDSWAQLRAAIRGQFFPENVEYRARKALRELQHTGPISDYVKTFSGLMLNIRDMSETDKLFAFLEGLRPSARLELQRQKVTNLSSAMAAAERLMDFSEDGDTQVEVGALRLVSPDSNKSGGESPHRQAVQPREGQYGGRRTPDYRLGGRAPEKKNGCFLCDGPHRIRECPKKQLLNALAEVRPPTKQVRAEPGGTPARLGALTYSGAGDVANSSGGEC